MVVVEIQARKRLHRLFDLLRLKIAVDVCHQTVNFLDITLNLTDSCYQPYRKPCDPLYISSNSNHTPAIIKQLPISINKGLQLFHQTSNPLNRVQSCTRTLLNAAITNRNCIIRIVQKKTKRQNEKGTLFGLHW